MAIETGDFNPMINGREYSWGDIKISILGRILIGVTAIKYGDNQESKVHGGAGNMPQSYGKGEYKATCSIKLQMKEIEALQASLPKGKRLQDISPFPGIVSYVNESDDIITHTLNNLKFNSNGRDIKQGDTVIEQEFEMMISHIDW